MEKGYNPLRRSVTIGKGWRAMRVPRISGMRLIHGTPDKASIAAYSHVRECADNRYMPHLLAGTANTAGS
jgi:hypothetical protein